MSKKSEVQHRMRITAMFQTGTKLNVIHINAGNTLEHELTKCYECIKIAKAGEEFVTEAVFKNGKRCDVANVTREIVREIVMSESEASLLKKAKEYPMPIETVKAFKINFKG
jgi:hypothetical protein